MDFPSDYDRSNPVTDEEATKIYLEKIEKDADVKKLNLMKQKTVNFLQRDTLGEYAKRQTMSRRTGLYFNHSVSNARASYQVRI